MKNDPTTTAPTTDPSDSPEQETAFEQELEQILGGGNAGDGSDAPAGDDDAPETGLDTPDDDGDDDLG